MKTFEELGVSQPIRRAIEELGFAYPMPVQETVIPHLLGENTDIVALAQTGTGKTAAFGLPLIQETIVEDRYPQSLILCPTRELCLQIAGDLSDYAKYIEGLKVLPVYGGSSIESQIRSLKNGVHIIVATPGRLIDLMERKTVSLENVRNVVMDEADEMLDMGFTESINTILARVPEDRHTLLFSATMSKEIGRIAQNYLHNPIEVTIGRRNEGTANVKHVVYMVHAKDMYQTLKRIVDYYPKIYGIIFCRTRRETQEIADKLMQEGYNADSLHGDLSQAQRDLVMQKFRIRNLQLLVATDVAARGLDVDDLTHIINYGLPDDPEVYTHRSGRTGRAGKTGTSIAIINLREKSKIRIIEKGLGREFAVGEIPTAREICKKQLFKVIDDLEKVKVNEDEINEFMPEIYRKLDWLGKEDVIKRLVSREFNRFFEYYHDREEITSAASGASRSSWDSQGSRTSRGKRERREEGPRRAEGSRREEGPRRAEEGYSRLYINLGKIDSFGLRELMDLLNKNTRGRVNVGRVDLMKKFSFFEVEEKETRNVIEHLDGISWRGRRVGVEIAQEEEASAPAREHQAREDNSFAEASAPAREHQAREDNSFAEAPATRRQKAWEEFIEESAAKRRKSPAKAKAKAKAKPKRSRAERGYTKSRGKK